MPRFASAMAIVMDFMSCTISVNDQEEIQVPFQNVVHLCMHRIISILKLKHFTDEAEIARAIQNGNS
jgi:hypothetical protein